MRKVAVLALLVLCIGIASATVVTMQVSVNDNKTIPLVNVFVNGINLDNKVKNLESEYDQLYNYLMNTKVTIADLMMFVHLKYKLLESLDRMIVNGIKEGKNVTDLIMKKRMIEAKSDALMLRILSGLMSGKKSTDMGWFDNYGNHRSFGEVMILRPNEVRLTDCSSREGRSVVVKGDSIKISGFVYFNGATNKELVVKLTDPYTGRTETVIGSELGQNVSNAEASIVWPTKNGFVITLNTSGMTLGLKQVSITFGNYTAYCQFVVEKPYIKEIHVGDMLRIQTNYPYLIVDGKKVSVVDGVLWLHGNHSISPPF